MRVKKIVLGLPVAAIALSSVVYAEGEAPTLYGRIDTSFGLVDNKADKDKWEVAGNASRLGVKGTTALDNDLEAIYKIEYEIFSDEGEDDDNNDGDSNSFKPRDIYVAIKSGFGTFGIGRSDSPLKKAQYVGKGFDQFNDHYGDLKHVLVGDSRIDNQLFYQSNDMNGVTARVAIMPGEQANVDDEDGPADRISVLVKYNGIENLDVAAAIDADKNNEDILRLVAAYTIDDLQLAVMYQSGKLDKSFYPDNEDKTDGFGISAAYNMGRHTIRFQYIDSEQKIAGGSLAAIGADCKLGKKTKAYVEYTSIDGDADADQTTALALGIQHKF